MQEAEIKSSLDDRIVKGYLCIWGKRNLYGEIFLKGAFTKSIQERGPDSKANYQIKFLDQHNTCKALSLFAVLEENDIGLYFETVPLDPVQWADDVLIQLRSGTLNNYSMGFNYVWDEGKMRYDSTTDSIVILEAILLEGSVVTIPADMETFTLRAAFAGPDTLTQDIDDFINSLPRPHQLEARHIFTRQQSLIPDMEPLEQVKTALQKRNEPVKSQGLDYDYITKNFTL